VVDLHHTVKVVAVEQVVIDFVQVTQSHQETLLKLLLEQEEQQPLTLVVPLLMLTQHQDLLVHLTHAPQVAEHRLSQLVVVLVEVLPQQVKLEVLEVVQGKTLVHLEVVLVTLHL
tara:strand:- start:368 stop:712 length:345 start_codon:yes stop_codon:yes gene_type:complete